MLCGTQLFASKDDEESLQPGCFGRAALVVAGASGAAISFIQGLKNYNYFEVCQTAVLSNAVIERKAAIEMALKKAAEAGNQAAIQKASTNLTLLLSEYIYYPGLGGKPTYEVLRALQKTKLKLFGYGALGLISLAATVYGARWLYKTYQARKNKI